ncbi:MAG: tetratricopeptide repeat protein [Candidatus Zixiibacteriota bacterium]|nr:MAG: tetratricopeptide repeat protein [candidate division Zixibacteria bacterium]
MKSVCIISLLVMCLIIAFPIYSVHADDPENTAESYYLKARAAYEQDNLDKAADLMEKALKLDPDNCEYHWVRGDLQGARAQKASIFTKISKAKSCKKHWERAFELCPDSIKYLEGLMYFNLQAPGIAGGDKNEAERLLQEIYARDSTRGYLARADIAVKDKDYEKAREIYDRLLAAGRDTLDVLRRLGNMYNYHLEDYGQARPYYLRVLAVEPEDWAIVYQAARTAILNGNSAREAIELMRRYLTHPAEKNLPGHAAAYWRMGMAYEQLGNPDSALACYEACLKLEPDYKKAKKSLKDLKKKTNR